MAGLVPYTVKKKTHLGLTTFREGNSGRSLRLGFFLDSTFNRAIHHDEVGIPKVTSEHLRVELSTCFIPLLCVISPSCAVLWEKRVNRLVSEACKRGETAELQCERGPRHARHFHLQARRWCLHVCKQTRPSVPTSH